MISNNLLQTSLIVKLKADATLVALLAAAADIKEGQWQGDNFTYPAVRLELETQVPDDDVEPCAWSTLRFTVQCFSSNKSSLQADKIAGAVNTFLHLYSFSDTQDTISFRFHRIRSVGLLSARRTSAEIWQADATFSARIHTR